MLFEESGMKMEYEIAKLHFKQTFSKERRQTLYLYLDYEKKFQPSPNCVLHQKYITSNMRNILFSWMLEVQLAPKRRISDEIFFMAINILDRYLSKKNDVLVSKFQLVGIVSFALANSTMNELYEVLTPPEIEYLCAKTFTKKEILKMQWEIFETLDYDFHILTSNPFLFYYSAMMDFSEREYTMCSYIYKCALQDASMHKFTQSLMSFVTIYIVDSISLRRPSFLWWRIREHCKFHFHGIKFDECLVRMVRLLKLNNSGVLWDMYSDAERFFVSKFVYENAKKFDRFVLSPGKHMIISDCTERRQQLSGFDVERPISTKKSMEKEKLLKTSTCTGLPRYVQISHPSKNVQSVIFNKI